MGTKRIILKTAIYRGVVTAILFALSLYYTGDVASTTSLTIVFNVLATVAYFVHEKLWDKVQWGQQQIMN